MNDRQRDFGDTAMVKPHLAFTHTRELLGKQYTPTLATAYGPQYFPYEIVGTPLSVLLSLSLSRALSPAPMRSCHSTEQTYFPLSLSLSLSLVALCDRWHASHVLALSKRVYTSTLYQLLVYEALSY